MSVRCADSAKGKPRKHMWHAHFVSPTHPFLPYVAPHFSHIPPFILVFQVFGGEFLGMQRVDYLRGFFSAFFKLEMDVWGGFLAGWPNLPGKR